MSSLNFRRSIVAVITACLSLWACHTLSASERAVYWAGISFIGDADSLQTEFPFVHSLHGQRDALGVNPLERQLMQRLLGAALPYEVKTAAHGLADVRASAPLVMTCSFDLEEVRVEPLRDFYRISVLISAQLLVFDFETRMIVSAHPVLVQVVDVADEQPSEGQVRQLVENALLDEREGKFSVFAGIVEKARVLRPDHRAGARVQVARVEIMPEAAAEAGMELHERVRIEHGLAYQLGKYLSENAGVPVLPYIRNVEPGSALVGGTGQAIGHMTTVFANGDVFNLQIPTADYQVVLQVDRLIKQEHAVTSAATTWVYGMATTLRLEDPFQERTIAERRFKYGRSEVVSNRQSVAVDHFVHVETAWALFSHLTNQFMKPDKSWLGKHDLEPRSALREMQKIKTYFDRCR